MTLLNKRLPSDTCGIMNGVLQHIPKCGSCWSCFEALEAEGLCKQTAFCCFRLEVEPWPTNYHARKLLDILGDQLYNTLSGLFSVSTFLRALPTIPFAGSCTWLHGNRQMHPSILCHKPHVSIAISISVQGGTLIGGVSTLPTCVLSRI